MTHSKYVDDIRKSLEFAYEVALKNASCSQSRHKQLYDRKVRGSAVEVGDRVLIRNLAFTGPHKLADRWQQDVYVIQKRPVDSIPVFELRREDGRGRTLTLHRNLLLPVGCISDTLSKEKVMPLPRKSLKPQEIQKDSISSSDGQSDSESSVVEVTTPPVSKPIPAPRKRPANATTTPPRQLEQLHEDTTEDSATHDSTQELDMTQHDVLEESLVSVSDESTIASEDEYAVDAGIHGDQSLHEVVDDATPDEELSSSDSEPLIPRRTQRTRKSNPRYDPDLYVLQQQARCPTRRNKLKRQTLFLRECLNAILQS